ncbi:hypothetical protein NTE_02848 [Candidatus Nitrososphaera evergladensis SR1]|jgi:hypothetical protein|uniref:Uncharacterized protein n=1 Tax=Candidatus Nitrososphaera evergladensis SR1 TaxID=1459636 RepID=A0A075MTF9_9ARCH|nr:hypothetical protein [Candidatus Nitrososphaera evergladensis]AIF84886.1 hypothetical protein NTE_02848 [Candidatus Nitrososphaera evergladensis SR1]
MKLAVIIAGTVAVALLLAGAFTAPAFAHQRQLYTIGGKDYLIVIGSLNEPAFVDDKTGVDLRVLNADPSDPMNSRAAGATPVTGLEQTLKVEIGAGDKKKEMPLEPVFNSPGQYSAPFYPTIATTYTYHIFGTINNTPVNLTFSCTPAGEAGAQSNNSTVTVSEGVVRKGVTGGYGCFEQRTDAGFPEPYMQNNDVSKAITQLQSDVASVKAPTTATSSNNDGGNMMMAWAGVGLGIVGIAIGAVAVARRGK